MDTLSSLIPDWNELTLLNAQSLNDIMIQNVLVINVDVFKFYDGQMLGGMEFKILKFRHHLVTNGAA